MFNFFQLFFQIFYKAKNQKGLSLYLAVVIVTIILTMVLGISTILVGQIKMMEEIENSVIALYGADTGIEHSLKEGGLSVSGEMDLGEEDPVTYTVTRIEPGVSEECPETATYCIESVGLYRGTKRAIRARM